MTITAHDSFHLLHLVKDNYAKMNTKGICFFFFCPLLHTDGLKVEYFNRNSAAERA